MLPAPSTTTAPPLKAQFLAPGPCRCGEDKHLYIDPCGAEGQFVFDADFSILRDGKGQPLERNEPYVWCRVCDSAAPLTVWNATSEANAAMRAATLAVWDEYSDETGEWMGAVQ